MEVPQENSLYSYPKQAKMSFSSFFSYAKLESGRAEQVLPEGIGTGEGGEVGKW
jgi:hypothetical protein